MKFLICLITKIHQNKHPAKYCRVFINIFIQEDLFFFITVIVERERKLLHLPEAVNHININRLLVSRCRGVIELERFFLQQVQVIGHEYHAVIHFQLPFAVRLEVPYLIGSRLVIAVTHQLAAYFGGFTYFQPFGYLAAFRY